MIPAFLLVLGIIYYYALFATIFLSSSEGTGLFANFHQSFLTFIQIMTLDNWSGIARTVKNEKTYSFVFFASFVLIVSYFVVNIITGLIAGASEEITMAIFDPRLHTEKRIYKTHAEETVRLINSLFRKKRNDFQKNQHDEDCDEVFTGEHKEDCKENVKEASRKPRKDVLRAKELLERFNDTKENK